MLLNVATAESIARVMKADGDVTVKKMGGTEFTEAATPGYAIDNGDALRVGEAGFAVIVFIDDRSLVKVKENTEFEFIDTDATRTLKIENGTLLNKVAEQGRNKTFRVETPTSVASVKGTEFSAVINTAFGVDQFFGQSGLFEVLNLISQQVVNVGAGQKAISNNAGALIQAPAGPKEYPEDPEAEAGPEQAPEEAPEEAETGETETGPDLETPAVEPGASPEMDDIEVPDEMEKTGGESKLPFDLGMGIGAVTLDGQLYNQIALRPEFSFGKLGLGLDIVIYMDGDGNIRKDDWDFIENPSAVMDKIMYVSWAEKGDPFWIRVGTLPTVTLGYGGLINGYSNMMEYPTVRQLGVNGGVKVGKKLSTELFMSNVKDLARGGTILGARASYQLAEKFPLTLGANLVVDINQFSGLMDKDKDDVPDIFDAFPEVEFNLPNEYPDGAYNHNSGDVLKGEKYNKDSDGDGIPDELDYDRDGDGLTDQYPDDPARVWPLGYPLDADPLNTTESSASVIGMSVDAGYPIFKNKIIGVDVYTELNQLIVPSVDSISVQYNGRDSKFGTGFTIPGVRVSLFNMVQLNLEYRMKTGYYVPRFFDQSYDISRIIASTDANGNTTVMTKDELVLTDDSSQMGYYGSLAWDIFGFASITGAYANMMSDDEEIRSFMAVAGLNTDWIPKLSMASAYYMRNNDPNPFDFKNPSVNTILGYMLGYEVSPGVSLVWNFSQYYRDTGDGLKPVRQTTIETAFNF